ncbi:HAMP domain-containing methyl-accepting chemotaxis protein [Clostridium grantii]|uniref:Methyl-accepting chemotaxis protein n=1 Tax=Clostridium grantii DSM 8605 TaxID=1121316 RepID=A0A1M5UAZ0_9CLOT|nr:methyl-accepting chemotaxis protein [Clostridium grantii]SHH60129.1 methyl-accepting chemotaxis protein [Clostridium grantii DSM 8605]
MKWFKNLKIKTRILSGFAIITIIAIFVGLVGFYSLSKVENQLNEVVNIKLPSVQALLSVSEIQTAIKTSEKTLLIDSLTKEERLKEYDEIKTLLKNSDKELEKYAPLPKTDEETKEWNTFINLWIAWRNDVNDFVIKSKEYDTFILKGDINKKISIEELIIISKGINDESFKLSANALSQNIDLNKIAAENLQDNSSKVVKASKETLLFTLIGSVLISIILGMTISSMVSKPLKKILDAASLITNGDLNVELDIDTKDEIGVLANEFKTMSVNLNMVISGINTASEEVATGSKQVSDSSLSLAQGATEQAASIKELTVSIEKIAIQTNINAKNANEVKSISEDVQKEVEEGYRLMKNMLKAMNEINESSSNISKIINVIDEIAFQTNILALNAAIEAAKAGQHGKGFALVAEEVRNLALRSSNAAKETTFLIEGSIKKVEDGTNIANTTSNALNNIVTKVKKSTKLVGNIAIASNEQAVEVQQISTSISEITEVVQSTSATSEQTAAASEELLEQSEVLKNQVSTFKLKKEELNIE